MVEVPGRVWREVLSRTGSRPAAGLLTRHPLPALNHFGKGAVFLGPSQGALCFGDARR